MTHSHDDTPAPGRAIEPAADPPEPISAAGDAAADPTLPTGLAPAVQLLWRLGLLAQAVVPSAGLGAVTWFLLRPGHWPAAAAAALAPWLIAVGLAVRLPPRRFAAWRYALAADALRLARGVMFRSESVVPYTRIQHVDTEQGPLERLLGLAHITVHTASGTSGSLTIPGLTPEVAATLRDRLARRAGMVEPL